jgi:hypothetical protein
VVHAGLGIAVEVLAGELGDTERQLETGPLVDVGLEVFELDVVPVDEHLVDMAVTAALVEEIFHPIKAVGSGSCDRASESVTLIDEGPEILIPNADGCGRIGLGLSALIDLVETEGVGSVTGFGELDEAVNPVLAGTPEHDADRNASVLDCRRNLSVPKVEHLDALGSGDESNPLVVAHSPSNSKLSGTGGSVGRGLGLDGLGRLSGGGGRVVLLWGGVRRCRVLRRTGGS